MATINIRVDDRIRDALNDLASAERLSLSELIRNILREAVIPIGEESEVRHGDEAAPDTLRFIDRKTLSMLHLILGYVRPEGADDAEGDLDYQSARARTLERGFTGEYWMEVAGFAAELSKRDCRRVIDVLQMFRVIKYSLDVVAKAGVAVDTNTVGQLSFRGFDHNDPLEGQMADYVRYLVDGGKWSELRPSIEESDGGNSHMPTLPIYARMLAEYRRIVDSEERQYSRDDDLLSVEELGSIAAARVHPDHRTK